ncbi:deubiquitinating protein VCPIP1-like [Corticium candelabrum]|uniref:deubiquitinating protein VCPIP1-like n=1 Tax=Corticium candelabrum TaxID=121492 RepID=UPI002E2559BA|nr:deubiquitinating protein VCPIP1-like [Corticium candelabrum]
MKRRTRGKYLSGTCPNVDCNEPIVFPKSEASVECPHCGQRYDRRSFTDLREDVGVSMNALRTLTSLLYGRMLTETRAVRKAYEMQKVNGVAGYECKLLSPLLTSNGMDKAGVAVPLAQLNQKDVFDCAALCDRTFMIEEDLLDKVGYGCDVSGAASYLKGILGAIKEANDGEDRLVPIHVDGDGHCLVHAVSRCLVGRELFWHALRTNMRDHLVSNLDRYQAALQDFGVGIDWEEIIAEADADYRPAHGEAHGLGNIHIFALANVLRRPIILLDGAEGMQSSGDYSATFLPSLYKPDDCQGKKGGELNSPIVIAWSSLGRNHFIPIVAVKSRAPAFLPKLLLPDVWGGFDQQLLSEYVTFDNEGRCAIGGGKALSDSYLQKLIHAMKSLFTATNGVSSVIVSDVQEQVLKKRGVAHLQLDDVIQITKSAVDEKRLFRCIDCSSLTEISDCVDEMLLPGGELYEIARDRFGELDHNMELSFPMHHVAARYDKPKDRLLVTKQDACCSLCSSEELRVVAPDGTTRYKNGDRTTTRLESTGRNPTQCSCGFKHFWNGNEYDYYPSVLPIKMEWQGETKDVSVYWFDGELDPKLNSNAYQLASDLVNEHFPGEFGSERLVQQVVDMILKLTKKKAVAQANHEKYEPERKPEGKHTATTSRPVSPPPTSSASKIILTGEKHKTIHKEELTRSQKEREVKQRIERNAVIMQSARSGPSAKTSPSKTTSTASSVSSVSQPAVKQPKETTRTKTVSQEKKLRISSSDGRTVEMTFPSSVTFKQLIAAIRQQLDVPTGKLKIRYGFPPKELQFDDKLDDPLPLQHGEKLSVEIPEERQAKQRKTSREGGMEPLASTAKKTHLIDSETAAAAKKLKNALLILMSEMIHAGHDVWGMVETMPEVFEEGGLFYDKVRADLQTFDHGLHCRLVGMKGKTFAVNLRTRPRRLDLCLGTKHIRIGSGASTEESQCSEDGDGEKMAGTLSGVVRRRREAGEDREVFSGVGHSLKESDDETHSRLKDERDIRAQLVKIIVIETSKLNKEIQELREREEDLDERIERLEQDQEDDSDDGPTDNDHIFRLKSERYDIQAQLKLKRQKVKDLQSQQSRLTHEVGSQDSQDSST